jgi:hypothetical protein
MNIRTFLIVLTAIALLAGGDASLQSTDRRRPVSQEAVPDKSHDRCFACTQVIGYSQVGQRRGGWYVSGGVFESIVGADHWQLLWNGGAGVDRWQDPDYRGWSNRIVSPCRDGSDRPDRVVLSISGPYGDDEQAWARAIEATVGTIRQKIPSARQIVLQPVVGGPDGRTCSPPGRPTGRVRASWQHRHIENAIKEVVARHARSGDTEVALVAGFSPTVRTCDDYSDALGHLTPEGAQAAGRATGEYYARLDAECRAKRHPNCGRRGAEEK